MYEHSDASYRSRWFCVKKKDGSLRLVHDLQPLNAIYVGYDHRTLDTSSRDLTTVQSPVGSVRLTTLPQGWTGAGPIFLVFILEPEIPDPVLPYGRLQHQRNPRPATSLRTVGMRPSPLTLRSAASSGSTHNKPVRSANTVEEEEEFEDPWQLDCGRTC